MGEFNFKLVYINLIINFNFNFSPNLFFYCLISIPKEQGIIIFLGRTRISMAVLSCSFSHVLSNVVPRDLNVLELVYKSNLLSSIF